HGAIFGESAGEREWGGETDGKWDTGGEWAGEFALGEWEVGFTGELMLERAKWRVAVVLLGVFSAHALLALPNAKLQQSQDPPGKSTQTRKQKVQNPLNDLLDEAQAALEPLQKFIGEKPDVAYAHFQLAYAYTGLNRVAEARAEYERCIALDPKM